MKRRRWGRTNGNPIQYTTRENDGTGLYYYRARYYDPILKIFKSEDPIGLAGGLNSHRYVEGNPVSNADPSGTVIPLLIAAPPSGSYHIGKGSPPFTPTTMPAA